MHTLPHFDVASAAGSYATFGFLLVGFAFISLFHYLTERYQQDGPPVPPLSPSALRLIKKHDVKVAMLYAMASLLLTSYLYLELAGEATPSGTPAVSPPWTAAALVPYGVAFGLSVLMLFCPAAHPGAGSRHPPPRHREHLPATRLLGPARRILIPTVIIVWRERVRAGRLGG